MPTPYLQQARFVSAGGGDESIPPLVSAYVGHLEVIKKTSKTFTLHVGTLKELV
jgi:hypothetical protein